MSATAPALEASTVSVNECRLDAMLMALDDSDRFIDAHEPRHVELPAPRINSLLEAFEAMDQEENANG